MNEDVKPWACTSPPGIEVDTHSDCERAQQCYEEWLIAHPEPVAGEEEI